MSKHTHGRWKAVQVFANRWNIQVEREGYVQVVIGHASITCCEVGIADPDEQCAANARLIAQAPDMLSMLKRVSERQDKDGLTPTEVMRLMPEIRDLIKRVEGT